MIEEVHNIKDPLKILIVDDNKLSAELLYEVIGNEYDRKIVPSGKDALQVLMLKHYDLVFLDLKMPEVTGHVVLDFIRKNVKNCFVVIVSGHGTKDNVEKAIESKIDGFINKPFSRERVKHYICMAEKALEEPK